MSEIPRGIQIALQSFIKMMGLEPQKVQIAIEDIGRGINNVAADLATIRRQNTAIMAHLGIAEDHDHGRTQSLGNGQGSGAGESAGNA